MLQVFISWISFRFPRTRPVLEGEPLIVVQDGKPIERNLKRERLTLDELAESLAARRSARSTTSQWAVLERNGEISFIKKSNG